MNKILKRKHKKFHENSMIYYILNSSLVLSSFGKESLKMKKSFFLTEEKNKNHKKNIKILKCSLKIDKKLIKEELNLTFEVFQEIIFKCNDEKRKFLNKCFNLEQMIYITLRKLKTGKNYKELGKEIKMKQSTLKKYIRKGNF
jgi:hypothetical protein